MPEKPWISRWAVTKTQGNQISAASRYHWEMIDMTGRADAELDERPDDDREVATAAPARRTTGNSIQGNPGAVAGEDADHAGRNGGIPDMAGGQDDPGGAAFLAGQAGHQPDQDPEGRLAAPAVDQRVEVGGIAPGRRSATKTRRGTPGLWTLAEEMMPSRMATASQAAPLVKKNITGWRSETIDPRAQRGVVRRVGGMAWDMGKRGPLDVESQGLIRSASVSSGLPTSLRSASPAPAVTADALLPKLLRM